VAEWPSANCANMASLYAFFTEFIRSVSHTPRVALAAGPPSRHTKPDSALPCLSNSTELAAPEGGELEVHRSSEAQLRKTCDAC